ncbi:MurR/RpiR family transcriptional regulator [Oryzicola mucosus]|uniref:MurR/RpiR family transcriptional regulator n=1 Tax=Oryzicola mucosus TaxID=2767425 RepID=A0A8J6TZ49_9HYPH|nr:MurR/RpiR family transcriptional regulator [Oryzicola mucosus]MBD0414386.1 MurR/RpiR family transcriptional regulator [Oryzicola mucosus]
MNSSVAEIVAERLDTMPAGERRAAQTLVANYPLIGLKTVAEFSQSAGISSPTILRFVARLGFQNYAEFQSALQDELAAQLQSPLSRTATPAQASASPPLADAVIENIRETFRHVSERQISDIVEALAAPRAEIYLVGGRFTDPVARYMSAHMSILRPGVVHLEGQESLWHDRLADIGKRDVLIVLDIRRYQDSLLRFSEKAHKRGATVVLFTDQWLSPIARFARHVIAGRTAVPSAWDSSATLMVVAETVIGSLTRKLGPEGARRIKEVEELR